MYSPLATPTPTRMMLGPISLRSGAASGSSFSTGVFNPRRSRPVSLGGGGSVSVLSVAMALLPLFRPPGGGR